MGHDDDLDRILSEDEEILPSSAFAASVMQAVRREASTPPPIPFPWKHALPGIAAAAVALVLVLLAVSEPASREATTPAHLVVSLSVFVSIVEAALAAGAH